jgi:hypothetical protein
MENDINVAAAQVATRFLVTQLYVHQFLMDPAARKHLPPALIGLAAADAEATTGNPLADRLLHGVHQEVQAFFADVENRLQSIEGR